MNITVAKAVKNCTLTVMVLWMITGAGHTAGAPAWIGVKSPETTSTHKNNPSAINQPKTTPAQSYSTRWQESARPLTADEPPVRMESATPFATSSSSDLAAPTDSPNTKSPTPEKISNVHVESAAPFASAPSSDLNQSPAKTVDTIPSAPAPSTTPIEQNSSIPPFTQKPVDKTITGSSSHKNTKNLDETFAAELNPSHKQEKVQPSTLKKQDKPIEKTVKPKPQPPALKATPVFVKNIQPPRVTVLSKPAQQTKTIKLPEVDRLYLESGNFELVGGSSNHLEVGIRETGEILLVQGTTLKLKPNVTLPKTPIKIVLKTLKNIQARGNALIRAHHLSGDSLNINAEGQSQVIVMGNHIHLEKVFTSDKSRVYVQDIETEQLLVQGLGASIIDLSGPQINIQSLVARDTVNIEIDGIQTPNLMVDARDKSNVKLKGPEIGLTDLRTRDSSHVSIDGISTEGLSIYADADSEINMAGTKVILTQLVTRGNSEIRANHLGGRQLVINASQNSRIHLQKSDIDLKQIIARDASDIALDGVRSGDLTMQAEGRSKINLVGDRIGLHKLQVSDNVAVSVKGIYSDDLSAYASKQSVLYLNGKIALTKLTARDSSDVTIGGIENHQLVLDSRSTVPVNLFIGTQADQTIINEGTGNIHIHKDSEWNAEIDAKGSGTIRVSGNLALHRLRLRGQGNMAINSIDTSDLNIHHEGLGTLYLAGVAKDVTIKSYQQTSLDAEHLTAKKLFVSTHGNAIAKVHAIDYLSALAYDTSNIYYYGIPNTIGKYMSESGAVLLMASN